ncbi:MAG: DUF3144 domain-containing protein [Pseudomonadota bacterium]
MPETENETFNEFYDVVDKFIHLANDLNTQWPRSFVSNVLMYAAARYNTYNWLVEQADLNEPIDDATVLFFSKQYEKMFRDNSEELSPILLKISRFKRIAYHRKKLIQH